VLLNQLGRQTCPPAHDLSNNYPITAATGGSPQYTAFCERLKTPSTRHQSD
jgi:hypothetical protein